MRVVLVAALVIMSASATAPDANAATFPCKDFEKRMDRAAELAPTWLTPKAARAAISALAQTTTVVDRQDCDEFRYRPVHRWLARQWRTAFRPYQEARANGHETPRLFGRLKALETPITVVESAAKKQHIRLKPIRNAGDEIG